jgi:transposase
MADDLSDRKILLEIWGKMGGKQCPSCGHTEFYFMTRKRLRCSHCKQDFWPLNKTWFSQTQLDLSQWMKILDAFIRNVSVKKAAIELDMNYSIVLKAYSVVRNAIFTECTAHDTQVLEILCQIDEEKNPMEPLILASVPSNGKVKIVIPAEVSYEMLVKENVAMLKRGAFLHTERWKNYNTLLILAPPSLTKNLKLNMKRNIIIDQNVGPFISFLADKLIRFPRISKHNFIFYVVEMQWRYNNRDKDLFNLLIDCMIKKS